MLSPLLAIALQVVLTSFLGDDIHFIFYSSAVLVSTAIAGKKFGIVSSTILILSNILPYLFNLEGQTVLFSEPLSVVIFSLEAMVIIYCVDYFRKSDLLSQEKGKVKELRIKNKQLEEKYEEAQKEIKIRDDFLSIASHELKTPLTSMVLQLQTALHNIKNVSLANFSVANLLNMLEKAENQTKRLSRIINDLLDASRASSKRLNLEPDELEIDELVRSVVENFSEETENNGNEIKVDAEENIKGSWDRIRIEQAITNLISNAIKYGENKPVEVKVYQENEHVKIRVKDRGIGISREDKEDIFKLFERAHENKSIEGTGVGLYITDRIVKAHGGKIEVKSKQGHGSEFTIHLPLNNS